MNLVPKTLALGMISLTTASFGQAVVPQAVSQTNQVDYSRVSGTNELHHSVRWFEQPVKDPMTVLKEIQGNAQDQLSDTPIFTQQEGLYTLLPPKTQGAATTSDQPERVTAWDSASLHKESAVLDFSAISRRSVSLSVSNSPAPVILVDAPLPPDSGAVQFSSRSGSGHSDSLRKTRALDDDALDGVPGSAGAQPQIASPEPGPVILGAVFLGAWRFLALFRRRRG